LPNASGVTPKYMDPHITRIDRSNILILAFQLEGLCTALRQSIASGLPPGPATLESLGKLHHAFSLVHSGPSLELLPNIDANSSPSDILAFAEMLRTTIGAFLSPDEIIEKQRAIGFHP
jgi:hypothetical protein